MSSKTELLKKLKTMAERASSAEAGVAAHKLKALMEKYNISDAELESVKTERHMFPYKNKEHRIILRQVLAMVMGKEPVLGVTNLRTGRTLRKFAVDCTSKQAIEIEFATDLHWRHYKTERDLFLEAYIYRNHIFGPRSECVSELTPEQQKRYQRVTKMVDVIERQTRRQLIENTT